MHGKFLLSTICILSAATILSAKEQEPAPQKLPVVVAGTAAKMPFSPSITEIGEVSAEDSVALVARVKGYLTQVNLKEGQLVKKGTVVFQIDPSEYEAKVEQAKAALIQAKAAQANAESEYKRQKELYEKDAVSAREYDSASTMKYTRDAELTSAQASLKLAELDLSYTKITAPFDGYIGFKEYSVGNLVGPESKPLGTIERAGCAKISFHIPENALYRLERNAKEDNRNPLDAKIELYNQDEERIPMKGKLSAWDNKINSQTGTLKVQAMFDDPDRFLLPGLYLKVKLFLDKEEPVTAVPKSAVTTDVLGSYVYVLGGIQGNQAVVEQRFIVQKASGASTCFIESGLKDGEVIVVSGIQRVHNGSVCQFTMEGQTPAADAGTSAASSDTVKK